MAWDPTASKPPVWVELESSRGDDGVAVAAVECTPWNAGRRLAYENRVTSEAIKIDFDEKGGKIRKVLPGNLRRLMVQLTVTAVRGPFPEGFDPSDADHLAILDADVFEEIAAAALKVQPLPSLAAKRPADHKAPAPMESGPEPADDVEEGDGDEPDPFPTPSTRGA
jgi:hypothetical protein